MTEGNAPKRLRAGDVIDAQQHVIERLTEPRKPSSTVPTFKVAQVKAVGGNVVHEWDVSIPVCDDFPDAAKAFAATLIYAQRMAEQFPPPHTNGAS